MTTYVALSLSYVYLCLIYYTVTMLNREDRLSIFAFTVVTLLYSVVLGLISMVTMLVFHKAYEILSLGQVM